ncbi:MAG: MBOAT family O-acyltransferase [Paludibacteraceae bacterium]|nr:MBOAT family O-acyltransferase [Paludibacteraceae bacterium]
MKFFSHIFGFNSESPLLFTQFYFWAFFALVYAMFAIIMEVKPILKEKHPSLQGGAGGRRRLHLRNIFLLAVSWFFYYKTSGLFLLILLFVTLSDWLIANRIYACQSSPISHSPNGASNSPQSGRPIAAKMWLALSVVIDLGLLCYFKYAYFFTNVVNNLLGTEFAVFDIFAYIGNGFSESGRFMVDKIILPVGISFYLFQVMSYTIDVYRRQVEPVKNILDFGFYVSFFPGLVAGPIVRANEFIPQLYKPFCLSRRLFGLAVFWILNGLIKKIVLSDYLAVNIIDRVFDNPLLFSGFENLFALFAYSLQVYADFSGYTDIAIGIAMLMGFYLPQNFDSPYKSRNPQEFWRRWHMSLSRWLKSYLYIPLGGNRKILGKDIKNKITAGNINSFITMLLGGLWHGASWNFVIWGALNGAGMIVYKIWAKMNWNIKMLLMSMLMGGLWVAYSMLKAPIWNLFFVWGIALWIGTAVRYFYWWHERIQMKRNNLLSPIASRLSPFANSISTAWAVLQTFVFITFTRLFFRSGSNLDPEIANQQAWETAKNMVNQIGGAWNSSIIPDFLWEYRNVVILFLLGMVIHWLPSRVKRWYRVRFALLPIWVIILIAVITIIGVYQFVTADLQAFIYFQF